MELICPKESCSSSFKSQEELLNHQEKHHRSLDIAPPKAATKEARSGDGPTSLASNSPNLDTDDEEKSDMSNSLDKRQRQDAPKDHWHASSGPSALPQTGTQHRKAPASGQNISVKDTEEKVDGERVDHQPSSRKYQPLPSGMCPRAFETGLRIRSMDLRNLENGLKDLSLEELLGNSSSEQGSDDGESNYSW
ncbi:hypothetical protein DL98DRAFT_571298 [Cadophora sp. DSE1049]|nr:hypothetical protein DL98DRAFT_571298 [Cadophora sp. DSE1049]